MLTPLKKIEVKGKKFEVSIGDDGHFYAEYEREQIRSESLKSLTEKLASRIAKSKRVSIPFCMWEKESWSALDLQWGESLRVKIVKQPH